MEDTVLIQLTNQKAMGILHELEELQIIKVLEKPNKSDKTKLSEKYRGVFSKEDAKSFEQHTQTMRGEWDNI